MRAIGFKTKATREQEANSNNSPQEQEELINVTPLQAETFERINSMNEFICGNEFSKLKEEDKQKVLLDFSYYSKVAAIVL